jgi:hypothetical protein
VTSESWIKRPGAALIAFALIVGASLSSVHAVGDARKVSVVSFGLFGDQGVFRREASGAAQIVAGRFGSGPITCNIIRRNHPSFGCRDKATWTYFGDAFFNVALRQAKSLKDAFVVARALVQKRELREHFEPSNPLMAGGANVRPLLIVHP